MAPAIHTGEIRPVTLPPILAYIVGVPVAPRVTVERLIDAAIEALNELDGDPDREEDDPSGQCDEDEINTNLHLQWTTGAGCELSDPGGCDATEPMLHAWGRP
jgi:hypothetical protein